MGTSHVSVVALERHELISDKPFDDVLAAVHSGLGRPSLGEFEEQLARLTGWDTFKTAVADQAGSSGLLVFFLSSTSDQLSIGTLTRLGSAPSA